VDSLFSEGVFYPFRLARLLDLIPYSSPPSLGACLFLLCETVDNRIRYWYGTSTGSWSVLHASYLKCVLLPSLA